MIRKGSHSFSSQKEKEDDRGEQTIRKRDQLQEVWFYVLLQKDG